MGANRTVTVAAGTLTEGGIISGAYSLSKTGNGALTLSGANTYSGGMILSAGTLNINHATALGATSLFTIAGGSIDNTSGAALTLSNNNPQEWSADFVFKGSNDLNMGIGEITLSANQTVTVMSGTLTEGGSITGPHGLLKAGNGALTLSGANTFSGGLTLLTGILNLNNTSALGAASSVFTISGGTISNTSGAALTLGGNNLQLWNGDFMFTGTSALNLGTGAVSLSANRVVTVSAGTLTEGGVISGGYALTKAGAGRLTLLGANTYTGATTISAGTLQIGDGGANGSLSSLGALTNNATLVFNLSTMLTQGTDFASAITGTGALLQLGSGTLILSGVNTYTGATLISAGTLQIGVGGDAGALSASSSLINNATLVFNRANEIMQGVDFALSIGGTGELRQSGAGSLVLSGANVYTGVTKIEAGILQLGNGGTTGSLSTSSAITDDAILAFNRANILTQGTDFAWTIGGSGQVHQIGSGTLILGGANTYAGGTTLSAGRLSVNNAAALGTGLLTISGGVLDNTSGGAITLSSNNAQSWMADFTFVGSNNLDLGTGAVALSANRMVTVNAGTLTVGGTITGSYGLTKAGLGTLELNGANTFNGKTSVNGGTLLLGNNSALQNSAYNTNSVGTLVMGAAATEPVLGGVTGSGDFAPGTSVATLTLSPGLGVSQTYSGAISGSLALVKAGAGAQILTGASSYTGLTSVTAGMLKLAGSASIANSAGLSIGSGARFVFAPSSTSLAAGTLSVGTLSMASNSTLGVKWGKTIAVVSSPNLTGSIRLNMTGAYSSNVDYTVLTAPSGLNLASYVLTGVSDYVYTVTKTATSVVIRPTLTSGLATAYWLGGIVSDDPLTWTSSNFTLDSSFNTINGTSNWSTVASGTTTTTLIPGASTEVYLTDLASAGSLFMTTDADMALKGLTVTATNPVTLTDTTSSTLYLGGSGISVSAGAGAVTFGPAISLTESQSWTNSSLLEMVVGGAVDTGTSSFVLNIAGAGNMALRGAVSGSGSLTMSGSGMLTLSGENTYTGATVVNSGTLRVGAGGSEGSLNGTASITNNGSLVFNQTDVYGGSMEMAISGSGSLSLWNGILTLAASDSYTGGTTLGGGRLRLLGGSDRLSTSGTIALSAGVLDLGGYSQTTSGDVLFLGGTMENGTLTATGNAFDAQSGEVFGVLAGTIALNKTSSATLT